VSAEQQNMPKLLLSIAIVILLACVVSMFLLSTKVKELGSQVTSMNLTIQSILDSQSQKPLSEKLTSSSNQAEIETDVEQITENTESDSSVANRIAKNKESLKIYKKSLASLDTKIMAAIEGKGKNQNEK